ncbi:hypothetical protein B0H19DRAFT_1250439 [Mycena capillaripes]|nr:hypothetical protein B0H19DRAFT_1250439 [Mycena capillaripes]
MSHLAALDVKRRRSPPAPRSACLFVNFVEPQDRRCRPRPVKKAPVLPLTQLVPQQSGPQSAISRAFVKIDIQGRDLPFASIDICLDTRTCSDEDGYVCLRLGPHVLYLHRIWCIALDPAPMSHQTPHSFATPFSPLHAPPAPSAFRRHLASILRRKADSHSLIPSASSPRVSSSYRRLSAPSTPLRPAVFASIPYIPFASSPRVITFPPSALVLCHGSVTPMLPDSTRTLFYPPPPPRASPPSRRRRSSSAAVLWYPDSFRSLTPTSCPRVSPVVLCRDLPIPNYSPPSQMTPDFSIGNSGLSSRPIQSRLRLNYDRPLYHHLSLSPHQCIVSFLGLFAVLLATFRCRTLVPHKCPLSNPWPSFSLQTSKALKGLHTPNCHPDRTIKLPVKYYGEISATRNEEY